MTQLSPVTVPGPRRVVSVDLDAPLPRLVADETGTSALVVGYRGGFPVTTIDVLLTEDPADAERALLPLVEDRKSAAETLGPVADRDLPKISIVVSTIVTRVADIRNLLDYLEHLDYPDYEVVIVDNRVTLPEIDALPACSTAATSGSSSNGAPAARPGGTRASRRHRAR